MSKIISKAVYREAQADSMGFCVKCNDFINHGVEPDARNYSCENCGAKTVMGAEQAYLEGFVKIATVGDGYHVNRSVYIFLTKLSDSADLIVPDEVLFEHKDSESVALIIKYNQQIYTLSMDARYEASGGLCFSHPKYWKETLEKMGIGADEVNVGVKYFWE